jgi:predicted RNA-binding protein with PUA-like domain
VADVLTPAGHVTLVRMAYWFFVSDPESYHFDTLFAEKRTVWDGVHGAVALKNLSRVKKGDAILGYHSAPLKAVYCELKAVSDGYQKDTPEGPAWVCDVAPVRKLREPVPLAALKANTKLANMTFVKIQRVACSPAREAEYKEILRMGGA